MFRKVEKVMVLEEASEISGVGVPTLHAAILRKELNAAKIGKSWRLRESDLATWLDQKFKQPEAVQHAV